MRFLPAALLFAAVALLSGASALAQETTTPPPSTTTPPATTETTPETAPETGTPPDTTTTPTPDGTPPPADLPPSTAPETPTEQPADETPKLLTGQRAPTAGPQLEGPRDGVPDCRANAAVCWKNDLFAIWPRLRLRTGYELVQPDSQVLTVGQNDGFFLDQVRVGFDGAFRDDVRFRLIMDVVTQLPGAAQNDPVQTIGTAVRDAWVAWMPSDWFFVSAGQQFMPSDLEGSTTIAALPFARRSVATSGVRPGHGFAVQGLSPSRQMGLVIGSTENARLGPIGLEYLLGVGNGNGQNVLGNDNKLPAAYARVGVGFEDIVRVGVGGRHNPRTAGTLPNLFNETDNLGFVDVQLKIVGIAVAAQGLYKQTSFDTLDPEGGDNAFDTGLGGTAWITVDEPLGFSLFGLQPAYRISYYDPSESFADDALIENTLGLRWDVPVDGLPLTLFVDGTLLTETGEGVRDLDNARLTALMQLEL